jgi:hypothetical protein
MDIQAIRHQNLDLLVSRLRSEGTQKNAALALDMSASFLSQLIGGKKMGDEVARKIEAAQTLPHGWMDRLQTEGASRVQEPSAIPYSFSHRLRIDPEMIAAAIKLVRLSFENLDLVFDNEQDGVPLAFAYEYLLDREQRDVTAENLVDFSKKLAERLRAKADDETAGDVVGGVGGGNRNAGERRKAG